MTTLEDKYSDITLAKAAQVNPYVLQVHAYRMIDIYVVSRKTGCRVQGRVNTIYIYFARMRW